MKIVVLGDIHGRLWWKDIIAAEPDADKYVFLGDYVSTHKLITAEQQISNMSDILDFKEQNPDKVILLRGNHDCQHLFPETCFECCAYNRKVARFMHSIEDRFLNNTQWVYIYVNFLFSHAGVSKVWMENSGISDVHDINDVDDHTLFGFTPELFKSDFYGESVTQPPTWIRTTSLLNSAVLGYTQIVGHTSVKEICNIPKKIAELNPKLDKYKDLDIWYCDDYLEHYLVIEDGIFTVKKSPGNHVPN